MVGLDTSTVLALVLQEPGWRRVLATVQNPRVQPVLLGPVLTEVIIGARRKGNSTPPTAVLMVLQAWGCQVVPANEADLVRAAELLVLSDLYPGAPLRAGGASRSLSTADAQILAMADLRGIAVATRDTHWAGFVAAAGLSINVVPL